MKGRFLSAVLSGVFVTATACFASYDGDAVTGDGQTGLIHTISAKTFGMGRLNIGVGGWLASSKKIVNWVKDTTLDPSNPADTGLISQWKAYDPQTVMAKNWAEISYGFTNFLDLSINLPFYSQYFGDRAPDGNFAGTTKANIGDMQISMKFQYPPYYHNPIFDMSYYGAVTLPTGSKGMGFFPGETYYMPKKKGASDNELNNLDTTSLSNDSTYYFTSGGVDVIMKMLWTLDLSELKYRIPVALHFNYGVHWTKPAEDHQFLLAGGIDIHPLNWLSVFAEVSGESRFLFVDHGFKVNKEPLRFTPGITFTPKGGFYLALGADISLTDKNASNVYHLAKSNSCDQYLVSEKIQAPIAFTGNIGWAGFLMKNHKKRLPPPPIIKHDTVFVTKLDTVKKVDTLVNTVTKVDTLVNTVTKVDTVQVAPAPPPPPPPAPVPEQPKAREIPRGNVILRGVNFMTGKAILTQDSYSVLDEVLASLTEWPEIKIEISGHTDNTGSAKLNKELSYNRAKAVREYFITKGISADRLTAVGYGPDKPVADNKTADGRAQNRRVELHRID